MNDSSPFKSFAMQHTQKYKDSFNIEKAFTNNIVPTDRCTFTVVVALMSVYFIVSVLLNITFSFPNYNYKIYISPIPAKRLHLPETISLICIPVKLGNDLTMAMNISL